MRITEVETVSVELAAACADLVRQLTDHASPPTRDELERLAGSPSAALFVAVDEEVADAVLGMITLAVFQIPTGVRAWIEDLVVDEAARGRGIGEALTRHAIDRAAELGARRVLLTSSSFREAANRLYRRLGFSRRDTNFYELTIDD